MLLRLAGYCVQTPMQGVLTDGEVPKYSICCYLRWEGTCLRHDGFLFIQAFFSSRLSFSVKKIQTLWGIGCVVLVQHWKINVFFLSYTMVMTHYENLRYIPLLWPGNLAGVAVSMTLKGLCIPAIYCTLAAWCTAYGFANCSAISAISGDWLYNCFLQK